MLPLQCVQCVAFDELEDNGGVMAKTKKTDAQRIKDLEAEVADLKRRITSVESMTRPIVSPWNPPPMIQRPFRSEDTVEIFPVKRL